MGRIVKRENISRLMSQLQGCAKYKTINVEKSSGFIYFKAYQYMTHISALQITVHTLSQFLKAIVRVETHTHCRIELPVVATHVFDDRFGIVSY